MARRRVALVVRVTGLLVSLSGLAASPAAASVLIGSDLSATPPASNPNQACPGFCQITATFVQGVVPASGVAAGGMTAPSHGVVVRWSMKTGFTSPATTSVRLRIVRPGLSVTATGAGSGASHSPPMGQASFDERLPIKAGDGIGLDVGLGVLQLAEDPVGLLSAWYQPSLGDGQTAKAHATGGSGALLLQAEIEPDVDGDVFGDESQDNCPTAFNPDQSNEDEDTKGDACDGDWDNDGLSNVDEHALGTSSGDRDSDDDGLRDGREDRNHNGRRDRRETDPTRFDTDRDGLSDGLELGKRAGVPDPVSNVEATDVLRFHPDRDPRSRTSPLRRDTDHDGVPDGREDKNHNGRVDKGETDPTETGGKPRRRQPG